MYSTTVSTFKVSNPDREKIGVYMSSMRQVAEICNNTLTAYYYKYDSDIDCSALRRLITQNLNGQHILITVWMRKCISQFIDMVHEHRTAANVHPLKDASEFFNKCKWAMSDIKILLYDTIQLPINKTDSIQLQFDDLPNETIVEVELVSAETLALITCDVELPVYQQEPITKYAVPSHVSIEKCKRILGII